jgi:hypothetical protein
MPGSSHSRPRVAYFYDPDVGNFHYGQLHPMKPHRLEHLEASDWNLRRFYDIY